MASTKTLQITGGIGFLIFIIGLLMTIIAIVLASRYKSSGSSDQQNTANITSYVGSGISFIGVIMIAVATYMNMA